MDYANFLPKIKSYIKKMLLGFGGYIYLVCDVRKNSRRRWDYVHCFWWCLSHANFDGAIFLLEFWLDSRLYLRVSFCLRICVFFNDNILTCLLPPHKDRCYRTITDVYLWTIRLLWSRPKCGPLSRETNQDWWPVSRNHPRQHLPIAS